MALRGEIQLCANKVFPSGIKHIDASGTTDQVGAIVFERRNVVPNRVLLCVPRCAWWVENGREIERARYAPSAIRAQKSGYESDSDSGTARARRGARSRGWKRGLPARVKVRSKRAFYAYPTGRAAGGNQELARRRIGLSGFRTPRAFSAFWSVAHPGTPGWGHDFVSARRWAARTKSARPPRSRSSSEPTRSTVTSRVRGKSRTQG